MMIKKILALALGLSIAMMPQISLAQVVELVEAAQNAQSDFNYDKAEAIWRQVVKLQPRDAFAYARLGDTLFSQNRYDEGIAEYEQALKLQKSARIYRDYGDKLREVNKLDASVIAYKEALKLKPKNHDAHLGLGLTYKQQQKYTEAIAELQIAISIEPDSFSYQTLGESLIESEKYDEGIAAFRQAIALEPGSTWLYDPIAEAYSKQGKTKEAIETYREAIKIDPSYVTPYINLANLLEFPQAVATLNQYIKEDPKNDVPLQALGSVLENKKQFADAFKVYQRAILINPSAQNYSILGTNLVAQNKLEASVNAYRQAIKLDSSPDDYRYTQLAEVFIKQNKFTAAMEMCQKSIAIKTKYEYFQSYGSCAVVGFANYQKQGISNTITMYRQFDQKITARNLSDLYFSLGESIMNSEKPIISDVKLTLREALKLNPYNKRAVEMMQKLDTPNTQSK
jgi:tetratricopeptide (TPR) repeat protein